MLHLIAFDDLNSPAGQRCLALYEPEDTCVFLDHGQLVAADFPLRGPGYWLTGDPDLAARPAALPAIDHDRLVTLIAELEPVTSWYPDS